MCNSVEWWLGFKGGEQPPRTRRLWPLLLVLGFHFSYVAFNHTMYVFQAYIPPGPIACQGTTNETSLIEATSGCPANCTGRLVFQNINADATIVTEWSLACSRAGLRPLMATLYFLGVAVGALAFGFLADRWGRRAVMLACLAGQSALGVAVSQAPTLEAFAACRIVQGAFVQGLQGSTFTLLLELFPAQQRTAVGVVLELYWALGLAVLAGMAVLLPRWRDLQLAASLPALVALLFVWWIPESRLWLASRGHTPTFRREQPGQGSYRATNKEDPLTLTRAHAAETAPVQQPTSSGGVRDLVAQGGLRLYMICTICIWFTVPLSYYGATFGMPSLHGDRFLNFAVGAGLEAVAYCGTFVLLTRVGRRLPMVGFLTCSAATCLSVAAIHASGGGIGDGGVSALALVLLCKAALVSAFCAMFLYTGELFPTGTRSAALGICGFFGRIGNLLAAEMVHLGDRHYRWLPFVLMGCLLLATAATTLLLPETLGRELPSTLAEAKALRLDPAAPPEQPVKGTPVPRRQHAKFNPDDYKISPWETDILKNGSSHPRPVLKESMSALELGRSMLEDLYKDHSKGTRARSYLETSFDEPQEEELQELTSEYKPKVISSAV